MRGITVEEIAEATKIGTRSLRALEQEQFEILPGGIFNKGFVRAYARFLGIDEEQAVADYLSVVKEDPEPPAATLSAMAASIAAAKSGSEGLDTVRFPWRTMVTIVVLVVLVALGWYEYQRSKQPQESSEPAAPSAVVASEPLSSAPQLGAAAPEPLTQSATTKPLPANSLSVPSEVKPTDTSAQPSSAARRSSAPITLRIRARSDAWLQITADDKIVMSAILPAAGEKTIRADKRVVLDIGNAGGVEVTHNGKPMAPLGPEGKRKIVTFTPEGLQQ